jgi:hypothetical protein
VSSGEWFGRIFCYAIYRGAATCRNLATVKRPSRGSPFGGRKGGVAKNRALRGSALSRSGPSATGRRAALRYGACFATPPIPLRTNRGRLSPNGVSAPLNWNMAVPCSGAHRAAWETNNACQFWRQSLAHEPPKPLRGYALTRTDRRGSAPPLACLFVVPCSGAHRATETQQHAQRAVSGTPVGLYLRKTGARRATWESNNTLGVPVLCKTGGSAENHLF